MISYIEKGIGLHDAIAASGHWLVQHDGIWVSDNDVAVQAIIDNYINRDTKLNALMAQYVQRVASGCNYTVLNDPSGSHSYQIDEVSPDPRRMSSVAAINAVAAMAARALQVGVTGTPWGVGQPPFLFYDVNNVGVQMTAQQVYDFASNIGTYVNALKQNVLSLKHQILSATTQIAVDAIDVTQGWPAN